MNPIQNWLEKIDRVVAAGPFSPTWESLGHYRIPQWYQDAKFGIFIHWGVYCVPAFGNEWYPRRMYEPGTKEFAHHLATYGPQAKFGYKDFIPMFKAEQFDPHNWAELFTKAGARFVMPVAEHHDGFAMYDTALSRWSAAKMGPKRDVIGDLAKAIRQQGMIFALSSHRAEHWWFFDQGMKYDSDVRDERYSDFYGPAQPHPPDHDRVDTPEKPDEKYLQDWLARTCELVDLYDPRIVWFDWWIQHLAFKPYLQKFAAYYYNRAHSRGQEVAINYKYGAFADGTAVLDIERGQLKQVRAQLWQNDTSVAKNSWGHVANPEYKTVTSILHDLIDVVSKNGALLLNIGPKCDGTIPEPEQQMLLEIGRWLEANGQAIYGTRPWKIFGQGPTEVAEGAFTDTKRAAFTHEDIRFTAGPNAIYATILGRPPAGSVSIGVLGHSAGLLDGQIKAVSTLDGGRPLIFSRQANRLSVQIPPEVPFRHALALKIDTGAAQP